MTASVSTTQQLYYVQLAGQSHGPYDLAALSGMVRSKQVRDSTYVAHASTTNPQERVWFFARDVPGLFSQREWLIAVLLSVLVGSFGVDRFYVGHIGLGILKLITCGGFGVWYIIDIVLFVTKSVTDDDGLPLR